jgi:hypothetical protein
VRFQQADDNVLPRPQARVRLFKHRVRLAHARGVPEEDPMSTAGGSAIRAVGGQRDHWGIGAERAQPGPNRPTSTGLRLSSAWITVTQVTATEPCAVTCVIG